VLGAAQAAECIAPLSGLHLCPQQGLMAPTSRRSPPAHPSSLQENKFKEAIKYYEPIVKKHSNSLLDITAIVLANLCVAYIMTSQNELAEELMRQVEQEEENAQLQDPDKHCLHLCIINLVIGTLYCSKGNYEFGISRIVKSLEPYDKKLEADTW
jgi:tetratricopeptide repeat protein 30